MTHPSLAPDKINEAMEVQSIVYLPLTPLKFLAGPNKTQWAIPGQQF